MSSKNQWLFLLIVPILMHANPSNHQVVHGQASVEQSHTNMTIQAQDKTIINWDSFSIAEKEITRFIQPSEKASVLNRVTGTDVTQIDGKLFANGRVYLLNPNGIMIGPNGVIDTAAFIATTLSIDNQAFLEQQKMLLNSGLDAKIINYGKIIARHGDVYLLGEQIENHGSIKASEGAYLYVGRELLLMPEGRTKVFIKPHSSADKKEKGIINKGTIDAVRSELYADGNLYALAINHEGNISSNGEGSLIALEARDGRVEVKGTLIAKQNTTGGEINILAKEVFLKDKSLVDVSATNGLGAVYIGGGYQGKVTDKYNAVLTVVEEGATIDASASEMGDAGTVIVWADNKTFFDGKINTTANNGKGGFVETSGKKGLSITKGSVDISSVVGSHGEWLLDPEIINIQTGGSGSIPANASNCSDTTNPMNIAPSAFTNLSGTVTLCANVAGPDNNSEINVINDVIVTAASTTTLNFYSNNITLAANFQVLGGDEDLVTINFAGTGGDTTPSGTLTFTGNFTLANVDNIYHDTMGGDAGTETPTIQNCNFRNTTGIDFTDLANLTLSGDIAFASFTTFGVDLVTLVNATNITFAQAGTFDGSVEIAGFVNMTSSSSFLTFNGTINDSGSNDSNLTIQINGGTLTFVRSIGATTSLVSLEINADDITFYNNPFTPAAITVSAGELAINDKSGSGIASCTLNNEPSSSVALIGTAEEFMTLNCSFDGNNNLTITPHVNASTIYGGAIGATTPIGILNHTQGGALLSSNITTSNQNITFSGVVDISESLTISSGSGAGNIAFSSTINGDANLDYDVIINAGTGSITYGGAIGNNFAIQSLTTTTTGAISLNGNISTQNGNVNFSSTGPVTLGTNVAINTNTLGGNVNFGGIVNGAHNLSISAGTGSATFSNAAGGLTPLVDLQVTASGGISIAENITLANGAGQTMSFTGPVSLTDTPITLDAGTGTNSIVFSGSSSTINGTTTLTLDADSGVVTLGGNIGNSTALVAFQAQGSGGINLGGNITTMTGQIGFLNPVTLTGNSSLTNSANSGISFSSTVDGNHNLTMSTPGTVTFTGNVGNTTPLSAITVSTADQVRVPAIVKAQGGTMVFSAPVVLVADTAFNDTGGTGITFNDTITGDFNLTVTAATINIADNITNSGKNISLNGAVNISGTPTISTGALLGGTISFGSTVNGAAPLVANAGIGSVVFSGAVGGTTPLTSLSATGNSIGIASNITTSNGAITLTGPINLTGISTISSGSGAGNISFSSTINGGAVLNVNAGTGTITYTGAVGGVTVLSTLNSTASGGIFIGANISLDDTAFFSSTYTGPITLTASPISIGGPRFDLVFSGSSTTINGANVQLLLGAARDLIIEGAIGNTASLGQVTLQADQGVSVGANITTNNAAILFPLGTLTLTGDSTMISGGGNISFSNTINGNQNLGVNAGAGSVTYSNVIGGTTPLASLTTTTTSPLSLSKNITTNNGAINFASTGAITLGDSITLSSGSGAGNISFGGTINGAQTLTVSAGTGSATYSAAVGGVTPLTALTTSASAGITIGGNITLANGTGNITFTGPATISATPVTLNSGTSTGAISFSSTINGADKALTLSGGSGAITLGGAVGNSSALGAFTVTTTGAISVGSNITTNNAAINFSTTGPVTLTGNSTMSSGSGAGNISFGGSIDGNKTLAASAGTGSVTYSGIIGGTTPIASLTTTTTGAIPLSKNITTNNGAINFASTGAITLGDSITLSSGSGAGNISFGGTINGAQTLTVSAGTGSATYSAAVGGVTPLTALTTSASAGITIGGNITLANGTGNITFTGPATISATPVTLNSGTSTGAISFSSTINGADKALTLSGGSGAITLGGAVGGSSPLGAFTVTTTGAISVGSNITTNNAAINFSSTGPITLTGNSTMSSGSDAGNISFGGTVDGNQSLTVDSGTGNVTFTGNVGNSTALSTITASGNQITVPAVVKAQGGTMIFNDPVVLVANTVFTDTGATGISFRDTITGNFDLTITATTAGASINVSGTIDTSGSGASNGGDVTITSGENVNVAAIDTSGGPLAGDAGNITLQPVNTAYLGPISNEVLPNGTLQLAGNLTASGGGAGADGTITLGPATARSDFSSIATIHSKDTGNNVTITGGTLTMKSQESMTIKGALTINMSSTATISEIVAIDAISITAPSIQLRKRFGAYILEHTGRLYTSEQSHIYSHASNPTLTGTITSIGSGNPVRHEQVDAQYSRALFATFLDYQGFILNFDLGHQYNPIYPHIHELRQQIALFDSELFFHINKDPFDLYKNRIEDMLKFFNNISWKRFSMSSVINH